MKEFMKDNQLRIEEIYEQYDTEIKNAKEYCSIEMGSMYCFTDYIKTYPNLDFMDKAHSHRQASTEQIINDDKYAQLIESLWLELDVEREKCCCDACTKEYCKIDCTNCPSNVYINFHKYFWSKDCEKIILPGYVVM